MAKFLPVVSLAAIGCLDDAATTAPRGGAVTLPVTALVAGESSASVTDLAVEVQYLRRAGGPVGLAHQNIELVDVAPGGSVSRPLTIELDRCLADVDHLPGGNSCLVLVSVALLSGAQQLDVVTIGPLELTPGQTAQPQAITLRAASVISISPVEPAPIFIGDRLTMVGTLTDASGQVVSDRSWQWTSSAPQVATVGADGTVLAVAPGRTVITATAGGRSATATVTVRARAVIAPAEDVVQLTARRTSTESVGSTVQVRNSGAGTLEGLTVSGVQYGGGASDWLSAAIGRNGEVHLLQLRITNTNLTPGDYTATVTLTVPGATNNADVRVDYRVLPGATLSLDRSVVDLSDFEAKTVEVTSTGPLTGVTASIQYRSSEGSWLSVSLDSSTTPTSMTINLDKATAENMGPGTHRATVTVNAPLAVQPVTLDVIFEVSTAGFSLIMELDYYVEECLYPSSPPFYGFPTLYSDSSYTLDNLPVTVRVDGPGIVFDQSGSKILRTQTGESVLMFVDSTFVSTAVTRVIVTLDDAPNALADTLEFQMNPSSCPSPMLVRPDDLDPLLSMSGSSRRLASMPARPRPASTGDAAAFTGVLSGLLRPSRISMERE